MTTDVIHGDKYYVFGSVFLICNIQWNQDFFLFLTETCNIPFDIDFLLYPKPNTLGNNKICLFGGLTLVLMLQLAAKPHKTAKKRIQCFYLFHSCSSTQLRQIQGD